MSRRATVACALLAAWAACGCAGRPAAVTRTGGLAVELTVRGQDNLAALYRVGPDGTLEFGGGRDARFGRTTWSGALTDEEIRRLRALIDDHGWYAGEPQSTGDPPRRRYDIRLRWPGGRRHYRVQGAEPGVEAVRALLDEAARRRLGPDLRRLPRPDQP